MDNEELKNYLEKLKKIEEELSLNDDNPSSDLINEVNKVLNELNTGITDSTSNKNFGVVNGVMIKVKKLHDDAVIPKYSKIGDAGMDLTITREIENTSFSVTYGFGIAMEIPKQFVGLIFPRSSVRNQDLILSNCVGVIDSGYRGEIQATFKKTQGLDSLQYKPGERAAQIIILPYPEIYMTEVPELSNTERGDGGFGSTGS
jgi:dUTP pyrophosphatase